MFGLLTFTIFGVASALFARLARIWRGHSGVAWFIVSFAAFVGISTLEYWVPMPSGFEPSQPPPGAPAWALEAVPAFVAVIVGAPPLLLVAAILPRGRTRKCPHCAERITREATVCPHCRRDVFPTAAPSS